MKINPKLLKALVTQQPCNSLIINRIISISFTTSTMSSKNDDKLYTETDGVDISRKRTVIEKETEMRRNAAEKAVRTLSPEAALPNVEDYMPQLLSGALFCGHLVTDMDSIAGSIGAAELYGGIPARASEVNSETAFCLELWGVEKPLPIEELLVQYPKAGVCLVDHQQTSQLNKAINVRASKCNMYYLM